MKNFNTNIIEPKTPLELQDLIKNMIATNTDSCTTDADIRYFETKSYTNKNAKKHDFSTNEKNRFYELCTLNDHPHIDDMWDDFWKSHAYYRKSPLNECSWGDK